MNFAPTAWRGLSRLAPTSDADSERWRNLARKRGELISEPQARALMARATMPRMRAALSQFRIRAPPDAGESHSPPTHAAALTRAPPVSTRGESDSNRAIDGPRNGGLRGKENHATSSREAHHLGPARDGSRANLVAADVRKSSDDVRRPTSNTDGANETHFTGGGPNRDQWERKKTNREGYGGVRQ
jgi:hypothetical protein